MISKNPLVSIIIPTCNRAHLIKETLDCILEQTYQNWECIVVDDGSNDNSHEVLDEYLKRDGRFQFYQRPSFKKKGASSCRNFGFEKSNGTYIQYLDSDDLISKNKIKAQIEVLEQSDENSITICGWAIFTESIKKSYQNGNLSIFKYFFNPKEFLYELGKYNTFFPLHSYLVPRNLIYKAGKWNEYLDLNDDGEFFTRVLLSTSNIEFVSDEMAYYRIGTGDNLSAYSCVEKANRAILSWKLIEMAMYVRYRDNDNLYVENAKDVLYRVIHKSFPNVILENRSFFKKQILYNRLCNKIIRKILKILKFILGKN